MPLAISTVPVTALGDSIRVKLFDTYGNWDKGCVLWWYLEDARGQHAYVGLDDRKASPTRSRLYQGVRHPAKDGCQWIELGSVEECVIVPLLSRWLDSPETWQEARRGRPYEEFLEYVQNALVQLGSCS